jgi:hypothetical protein
MPKEVNLRKRKEARDKRLKAGREKLHEGRRKKRRTSEKYMQAVVEEIGTDAVRAVVQKILEEALDGNRDAWNFLGRFILGNGKISLSDLASPGILKRKG